MFLFLLPVLFFSTVNSHLISPQLGHISSSTYLLRQQVIELPNNPTTFDTEERQPQIINLAYGTPVWMQIPAENVSRAKDFYKEVFHWKFRTPGPGGPPPEFMAEFRFPDARMHQPGVTNGGLVYVGPDKHLKVDPTVSGEAYRGVPHMYLFVKDIDHTLQLIEKAGGKRIGEKRQEDPTSYIAHFLDTEGNVQALYESVKH